MKIDSLQLFPEVKLISPNIYPDNRGFFFEMFNQQRLFENGIEFSCVQSNFSFSKKDVIRGMHFQEKPFQQKYVTVQKGSIYDVVVDVRENSKTFGRWEAVELDDVMHKALLIPCGFAHGFCALSDEANVLYFVDQAYNPQNERSFAFNDTDVGIKWPTSSPIISEKDLQSPKLKDLFSCIG